MLEEKKVINGVDLDIRCKSLRLPFESSCNGVIVPNSDWVKLRYRTLKYSNIYVLLTRATALEAEESLWA